MLLLLYQLISKQQQQQQQQEHQQQLKHTYSALHSLCQSLFGARPGAIEKRDPTASSVERTLPNAEASDVSNTSRENLIKACGDLFRSGQVIIRFRVNLYTMSRAVGRTDEFLFRTRVRKLVLLQLRYFKWFTSPM